MKKLVTKLSVTFALAAVLAGSTLALSLVTAHAQEAEDSRIVTQQGSGFSSTNAESTDVAEKPEFEIVQLLPEEVPEKPYDPNAVMMPGDKDMDMNDAAYVIADYIKQYTGVDTEGGKMGMVFAYKSTKSWAIVSRDIWSGSFTSADGNITVICAIDSITGQLYRLDFIDKQETADTVSDPFAQNEKDQLLASSEYTQAVREFVNAKLADKQIESIKNVQIYAIAKNLDAAGDESMINTADRIIMVAVELSDGSGYMIGVGQNTKNVYAMAFYPNGVQNYFDKLTEMN